MQKHMYRLSLRSLVLALASLIASPQLFAQCCPGGDDVLKAASGLGESFPPAVDLAAAPEWQVHEFERAGIRYLQVNDSTGKVRTALGCVDDVLWVLPIGGDADRVSIDAAPAVSGQMKVVYRAHDIEVLLHRTSMGDYWEVKRPNAY